MTNRQLLAVIVASLGAVILLCVTALLIWGSGDIQTKLMEAGGGLVAWLTVGGGAALILRDKDGDGIPDTIQPGGLLYRLFGLGGGATIERPGSVRKNDGGEDE